MATARSNVTIMKCIGENEQKAIAAIFETDELISIRSELEQSSAQPAGGYCPSCGGTLFEQGHEVVCSDCSLVLGNNNSGRSRTSLWDTHFEHRPRYHRSNRRICVGGFVQAYDWVSSDEHDGSVRSLDPSQFYK